MRERRWATGLGYFSIGLGLLEVVAARPLAKALGVRSATLLRFYGAREIAVGVGLLTQRRKGPWVWARVGGDALDVATLGAAALSGERKRRANAGLALAVVSPVVFLDALCGARLGWSR